MKFADGTKWRGIVRVEEYQGRENLVTLKTWNNRNKIKLNSSKCKDMHLRISNNKFYYKNWECINWKLQKMGRTSVL